MARIVRHEAGRVTEVISNGVASDWTGKPGVLIDPDESAVEGLSVAQWRVDAGQLRPATAGELAADAAAQDLARKERLRQLALDRFDAVDSVFDRAVALWVLDEINAVRANQAPPLAPITRVQMRNRIRAKVSGGDAD